MASPYNDTYIQYDGHVFNESLLNEFNYTIWGNGTLSNSTSNCYLVFGIFDVSFFPNGTTYNGTSCNSSIKKIGVRGGLGVMFGILFGLCIVLGITALGKQGKSYLPLEKYFLLVSRRWPWYWCMVAATCGCIASFVGVDVDRDYLQGTGLILHNIFYYVTLPAMLGSVWEMVRHWGSLCERILLDEDPWRFVNTDLRSTIEFYLPLVFYLFAFLTFFLSILRSWTMIANGTWSLDPSPAIKQATDGRFKASSVFALIAWGVIVVSVGVSLKFYPPVSRRVPPRIPLCLTAMLVRVVYNIAVAWNYNIGPLKPTAPVAYVYVLGFLPILFCMAVMIISARIEPNDDQRIIKLRRERERVIDIELDDQRRVVQEERARERQEQLGPGSMLKMPASSSAASADTRSGELSTITTPPPVYEA